MSVQSISTQLTFCWNFTPRSCGIHESSVLYLIRDFLVLVEWERSTQAKTRPSQTTTKCESITNCESMFHKQRSTHYITMFHMLCSTQDKTQIPQTTSTKCESAFHMLRSTQAKTWPSQTSTKCESITKCESTFHVQLPLSDSSYLLLVA